MPNMPKKPDGVDERGTALAKSSIREMFDRATGTRNIVVAVGDDGAVEIRTESR